MEKSQPLDHDKANGVLCFIVSFKSQMRHRKDERHNDLLCSPSLLYKKSFLHAVTVPITSKTGTYIITTVVTNVSINRHRFHFFVIWKKNGHIGLLFGFLLIDKYFMIC